MSVVACWWPGGGPVVARWWQLLIESLTVYIMGLLNAILIMKDYVSDLSLFQNKHILKTIKVVCLNVVGWIDTVTIRI